MRKKKISKVCCMCMLLILVMTSCTSKASYLQYDKKSISKDVEYLNTHYMEIDVDATSSLYISEFLDSNGTWYLKRDEKKEYTYHQLAKDLGVRIKDKGYTIITSKTAESGQTEVWERGDEGLKEQDASLDRIFEFYAMMNVRDNTKRTYTKEDKEFNKLVKYYSDILDPDESDEEEEDLADIDYFKIREGKTKGSTYLAVGGKYKEADSEGEYTSWEDAVEIRFDVDAKKFNKRYDELVHTVETTPLSKPQKRQ